MCLILMRRPPGSTRSDTLVPFATLVPASEACVSSCRSHHLLLLACLVEACLGQLALDGIQEAVTRHVGRLPDRVGEAQRVGAAVALHRDAVDRKSTRLNSSH